MRDFQETAARIVRDRPDLIPCLPAIEKELLHLEILRGMHDEGILRKLTFKGGTCLRLCYGAERLSEDLDFSGGANFDDALMRNIEDVLRGRIGGRYGLDVSVRLPQPSASEQPRGHTRRWVARVVTRPRSADSRLGVQRIKIEIDNREAEPDDAPLPVQCRYAALAADFTTFPVRAASLQDIRASKMVAYPMSVLARSNPRHRDVWDIAWFADSAESGTAQRAAAKAVANRLQDRLREALRETADRSDALVRSDGFKETLLRFLPAGRSARIAEDELHRQALGGVVRRFCEDVMKALPRE